MKNQSSKCGILENKYLITAFVLGALMQVIVVIIKPIADIFNLVALNKEQWIYTILISLVPIAIVELQKKLNEFRFGKIIYTKNSVKEKMF